MYILSCMLHLLMWVVNILYIIICMWSYHVIPVQYSIIDPVRCSLRFLLFPGVFLLFFLQCTTHNALTCFSRCSPHLSVFQIICQSCILYTYFFSWPLLYSTKYLYLLCSVNFVVYCFCISLSCKYVACELMKCSCYTASFLLEN